LANGVSEDLVHCVSPFGAPKNGIVIVILASLVGIDVPTSAIVFAEVDGELEEQTGFLVRLGEEDLVFGHGVVANIATRTTPAAVFVFFAARKRPTEGLVEIVQISLVPMGTPGFLLRDLVTFRTDIPKGIRITEINVSNGPYAVGLVAKVKSLR